MTAPSPLPDAETAAPRWPAVLIVLVALCCAIEAVLVLGDMGVFGGLSPRRTAYDWAGFWPGLLQGWRPNYAAQPYAMFLSYAFLHGDLLHLGMNMVTLWTLGVAVIDRIGSWRFTVLYLGTAVGGAAGYGLLADTVRPMVGASGALFGIAGALLAWAYVDRFTARVGLWPVAQGAALLIGINIAMYWALDGQLAWQTHLGGFLTGWVLAFLIDPRSRALED